MLPWNREHNWVLERTWHDLTRVAIHFQQPTPTVAELAAVRRCVPQFRDMKPAELKAAIGNAGFLLLGTTPTPEARELIRAAEAEQLQVVAESASFVSYLPHNLTTGTAWLIHDADEAAEVIQSMLQAGVPVRDIEA